jgi:hypothetical protein
MISIFHGFAQPVDQGFFEREDEFCSVFRRKPLNYAFARKFREVGADVIPFCTDDLLGVVADDSSREYRQEGTRTILDVRFGKPALICSC